MNNSSLSNLFRGLVGDHTHNQDESSGDDEQTQSISTPVSNEAERRDLIGDDNDESFWLDEKIDEDDNLWTNEELDGLFKSMCDGANPSSDCSFESVGFSQENLNDCMIIVGLLVHRRKKFLRL